MSTRAHVMLPDELIEQIDRLAGKRKRSRFVKDAIREKLARETRGRVLRESAGIFSASDYPQWETPERISEWVHKLRQDDLRASSAERPSDDDGTLSSGH